MLIMDTFTPWIPTITAWIATIITSAITVYQLTKNNKKEINKELNAQRLLFYPEVQQFMSAIYGRTWSTAMKEDEGRLDTMMNLTNKFIFWSSNDTLRVWIKIINEGQRGQIEEVGILAKYWAELNIAMRKDLGYGMEVKATELFPVLFAPKVVDKIHIQLKIK